MTLCSCPGCTNSDDDGTLYKEETKHGKGHIVVCGKHLNKQKCREGHVTVLTTGAASEANAMTLAGLQE